MAEEPKQDKKKIKVLERELNRKDKALAETAGKKGPSDLGGTRGRPISHPDRREAVKLIDQARAAGAR
ncbi:hypothetical protein NX722_11255 [Endozoicomonas gorgoniicola]|uniref:Uncharacterized protein n=1 Tax=Endozoicomonas gorgoniicola TaxID=1234144 RepID=A0ABT3MV04_9GAMM|nr:hypothetical protein [Endozoicomonas gorgoniicola]MCW7553205.1 hypothetical protein [Endozoicomonas gorgoniicola]